MDSSNSLEEQLREALRENGELQHLLYAAAHDLKQPLRTIASYSQILQRQSAANPETGELTSIIVAAVREMNTLIEDVLKYSRMGNLSRRTMMNLNSVVQWAWTSLQTAAQECDAQIVKAELPDLSIDESQFVQVFQQLFSNSIKFRGSEAPRIEVSAGEEGEFCTISIRDNGQGIEPRFHEQVFQPFKRLHGKEVPGSGLGLALCRKIVQAHGGKIWVESDGQRGSVFKFSVPI